MTLRALEHARWERATDVALLPFAVSGALQLPHPIVQIAGSWSVAVSLAGGLLLPSLQLSGSEVTAVRALNGSLLLPSLQLSGTLAPAVSLAGALLLPSLQLSGTLAPAVSKMSGWLRLAASSQSGGEWTPSIVDVLNAGSPMIQTGANRRAAVGASANGLPTMVFDGTDIHIWPLAPALSSITKLGILFWYKPATVSGIQRLWCNLNGQLGSSLERLQFYANGATIRTEAYVSNSSGGRFADTAAATLAAGVWHSLHLQYDSSRGGDPNLQVFINGISKSLTFGNLGSGATLTTLQAATGSASFGGVVDSDTPVQAISNGGQIGPNIFAFNDNLTAAELAAILAFEAPT